MAARTLRALLFAAGGGLLSAVACSSAEITSAASSAPVASVSVSPAADTLLVGDTQQLTAVLKDAQGKPVTSRPVTWASLNPAVATVSPTGLVTGVAHGTARITASSEEKTGAAALTVWPILRSPAECDAPKPEWIWCDDFEKDRLSRYFGYRHRDGSFVRAPGVGYGGSTGMRARFATAKQVDAGTLHLAFGKTPSTSFRPVDAGVARYREIYWRHLIKYPAGWIGGGGNKVSRAQSIVTTNFVQAMMAHVWSGSGKNDREYELAIVPASGTDASGGVRTRWYNDFANFRWLGTARSRTWIFDDAHIGKWYCIETRARLNDPGQSNGVIELWINGHLEAQLTGLNWLGSYTEYGINTVFLENYWNDGAPQPQERYFDNLVVSTQRIGC